MSMKNSNDTVRNRISDILVFSVVPYSTALPRAVGFMYVIPFKALLNVQVITSHLALQSVRMS
jgi:hypothetical protein